MERAALLPWVLGRPPQPARGRTLQELALTAHVRLSQRLPFRHPPCAWCWWGLGWGGHGDAKPMEDALVLAQVPSEADAKQRLVQEVQEVPER